LGRDHKDSSDDWKLDGIMLFGLNSAGKSTIQKAIGLSIIMAQSGLFVPATEYKFSPYDSLFTRITSNDIIFKGLSSFALEMTELRSILKRTGKRTLVIGDEVCRGTEPISGNSLVAATIIKLASTGSSFIFATHLHDIPNIKKVRELENVKSYHLNVDYDDKMGELVFDRKLQEGSGNNIYGITVARHIIHDNEFIGLAQSIKNELLQEPNTMYSSKQSRYNANVYIDNCSVCGDRKDISGYYETHHIHHQKDCDENGFIKNEGMEHIHKNSKSNLVPLCEQCHLDVHHDKLDIKGYKQTSNGRKLDFEYLIENDSESEYQISIGSDDDKVKNKSKNKSNNVRKKFGDEEVGKIMEIKKDGLSLAKAKKRAKDKYGIKIGVTTIKKIWNNSY
jgi:DNA mismatch repair protein MutS